MITRQRPYVYPVTDSSLSQASYAESPDKEARRRIRGVDQAMAASRVSLTLARISVSARLACGCGSPNLTI